jgi:hypothetical protein
MRNKGPTSTMKVKLDNPLTIEDGAAFVDIDQLTANST